ncbi:glutathione S-transferase family protein [Hoeflea poritis]|uniref:Glutathione S-transferase family protein n=1 Tax=Hoeflea poritis TaxID=2993659 RepID=A0ABT4VJ56_9HYPH|nr:glutathione S-transferase family protein [Hoeflea poritis]MDA4844730.1 glutathione S-transferase family protein [Hoeflea poritis]
MIRLYSIPPSLYSAKVRIVLRAKGLDFEDVPPPGGYGSDAYKEIVPSGTLPAIEHDGFLLVDSEAINEYLNELVPEPALWPEDIRERAQARALSRFHDTRLEPAVRSLFAHVDPEKRDTDFVAGQAKLIVERLAQFDRIADPSPLLTGETLSLADCGYPITLLFLEMLNGPMKLEIVLPDKIAAYFEALKREPSIARELDSYRPALAAWVESVAGPTA